MAAYKKSSHAKNLMENFCGKLENQSTPDILQSLIILLALSL